DGESQNYEGENGPQGAHTSVHENFGAEQSSGEDAEHHGHGHTGVDESAAEVDAALAAAVTPIMKLLVVVETLKGMRMTRSMAMTLTAPEPIPRRPESVPAPNMRPKPAGTLRTPYSC